MPLIKTRNQRTHRLVKNEETMTLASLPGVLRPLHPQDLVRLGRNNDGGYVVAEADVRASDVLIGLGLNDDWSFEAQFSALSGRPVVGYDASVGAKEFLKKAIKSVVPWFPGSPVHYLNTLVGFRKFFSGANQHFAEHVGLAATGYITMDQLFERHPNGKVFLKIDIEGSEYRLLDSILRNQGRITGLVIEFHDFDIHIGRVVDFVKRSSLKVVSVNANNFAGLASPGGLPLVVEVTFSSSEVLAGKPTTTLHQPNDRSKPRIEIAYS